MSVIKRCNFRPIIWRRLQRFFLFKLLLLQFAYAPAKKMRDCKGNIPFCTGFPIGARSIPVGTRFCFAKSSVLYLCFRLTRERGWRHTLRCGRVWQQTLFRGSRTGGFCDVSYSTNAGFLRSKIRLAGEGSRGIYSPRPAAAMLLFQRFFRFPLPWVMVVFPRWLMGVFRCLDFLRIPISETNSSFVSVS